MGYYLDKSCSAGGSNSELLVKQVRTRGIAFKPSELAAIGSIFTRPIVGDPIEHWWLEVETEDPNKWFCIEFDGGGDIALTQHVTRNEVNDHGRSTACRASWEDIKVIETIRPYMNMNEVYIWLSKQNSEYSLVHNNCQDLCNHFCSKFQMRRPPSERSWAEGGCGQGLGRRLERGEASASTSAPIPDVAREIRDRVGCSTM